MIVLLLAVHAAQAGEFLIFPLNSTQAVASRGLGGNLAAVFSLGLFDWSPTVLEQSKPAVEARFAAKNVPATVEVAEYSVESGLRCYAGEGNPIRISNFNLPASDYWALHVETVGAVAWLGDVSGMTRKQTIQGFRDSGVDVAICPLR